ncbi:hypothetical protein B8W69_14205 [Mycobacterium vulneris]|uniref:CBS domain-containing protein n=1 Tax=Mycolicibacterium vulneris TaxID=547163 RepID=A0A1X2L002_9MYCO|nr:CBS domain-containing protein [Mycolicibacterium vulneris]OSC27340.1 hypothetical protein B8W69_14205 [Mycolicibacterium vulneris]
MRAGEIAEKFPIVSIDSDALDAVRLLAAHRLTGLVIDTGKAEAPFAVLTASQVVRFILPSYVQEDPALAGVLTESVADHAAERLGGKSIRDVMPQQRQHIPVVDADDTIIELAEVMSRLNSQLVAVVKGGELLGVVTASRLLAVALNQ